MMTDATENVSDCQETDPDWENRRLCSDDSCIGIIGADGRCRVCGLLDPNDPADSDQTSIRIKAQEEPQELTAVDQAPDSQSPGWEDRKLCSDESCIGTIGMDGRCRICGRTE